MCRSAKVNQQRKRRFLKSLQLQRTIAQAQVQLSQQTTTEAISFPANSTAQDCTESDSKERAGDILTGISGLKNQDFPPDLLWDRYSTSIYTSFISLSLSLSLWVCMYVWICIWYIYISNQISPGTAFMIKVAQQLRVYLSRVLSRPAYRHLAVLLADSSVPGEGEHKIFSFLRRQAGPAQSHVGSDEQDKKDNQGTGADPTVHVVSLITSMTLM